MLSNPVGKIDEKAVCKSVFWTIWHCVLSAELIKTHSFRLFLAILPTEKRLEDVDCFLYFSLLYFLLYLFVGIFT